MKTISQLLDERDALFELGSATRQNGILLMTEAEKKKFNQEKAAASRRVVFLTKIIAYLETSPSEEFIKSEIKRIEKEIKAVNERFFIETQGVQHKDLKAEKSAMKEFNKKYKITHKKEQLRVLRFIAK